MAAYDIPGTICDYCRKKPKSYSTSIDGMCGTCYTSPRNSLPIPVKVMNLAFLAEGTAQQGLMRERIGAIAQRGKSIFEGVNSLVTHPVQARLNYYLNPFKKFLHAEISAMIHAKWEAERVVVVRLLHDGSWGMCKPCEGCQRALHGVSEVWYSTGIAKEIARL